MTLDPDPELVRQMADALDEALDWEVDRATLERSARKIIDRLGLGPTYAGRDVQRSLDYLIEELQETEAEVETKDAKVEALEDQITALERDLDAANATNSVLEQENYQLRSKIDWLETEVSA